MNCSITRQRNCNSPSSERGRDDRKFKHLRIAFLRFAFCIGTVFLLPSVAFSQRQWPYIDGTGGIPICSSEHDPHVTVVNVPHFVADQIIWNSIYPQFALIPITLEQAIEIDQYADNRSAVYHEAIEKVDRAKEFGDESAYQQARAHFDFLRELHRETHHSGFKVKLNEVLDEEQLSMLKSMCVDAAIQHWGIEPLLREAVQNSEHKLTREEYLKIEEKLRKIEFEMRKEVIQLRKKAWDDMMEALPPELRTDLEVRLNIDGIGKSDPPK